MSAMTATTSDEVGLRQYMLEEFKRRHALTSLRKELQANMPDKYVHLWWCKDEALREIRRHFVESTNHCVIDSFLGTEAAESVAAEINSAHEGQMLATDGMLTFQGHNTRVRTDVLGWFDCTVPPPGSTTSACSFDSQTDASSSWPWLQHLLQRIETVVSELGGVEGVLLPPDVKMQTRNAVFGKDFKLCKSRSRVMVTKYEGKDDLSSHYEKHLDNGNKNGRKVTAIYYVNKEWRRSDGGALRLYLRNHCRRVRRNDEEDEDGQYQGDDQVRDEDITEIYCDVEPISDRLVLFMSDARTPHEVLPTHKDRFAVTVWFWDPQEKSESDLLKTNREENSAAAL